MGAIRLTIRGRVQGVGYRWWAVETARRLGLDGWVRNRRDGSVELLAVGSGEALDALVLACRRGPAAATVSSVERTDAAADDAVGAGFHEQPTA
jgi:acylphosphatase